MLTRTQLAAALAAYVATVTTPFCGLIANNIIPNLDTTFGSIVEPTASWYRGRIAVVFGSVFDDVPGNMYIVGTSLQFDYTGTDAPTTIYGWFVATLVTAGVLVTTGMLPTPVIMATTLDAVVIQPTIKQLPF